MKETSGRDISASPQKEKLFRAADLGNTRGEPAGGEGDKREKGTEGKKSKKSTNRKRRRGDFSRRERERKGMRSKKPAKEKYWEGEERVLIKRMF